MVATEFRLYNIGLLLIVRELTTVDERYKSSIWQGSSNVEQCGKKKKIST